VKEGVVSNSEPYSVDKLTAEARRLAADYRRATGKTLPLSGEIAVNDAVRLLNLETPADLPGGCDAVRSTPNGLTGVQIKGRVVFDEGKVPPRIGQLKLDQPWQEVVLVLMDENYEPLKIYCADRKVVETALEKKGHNKRGAMTVAQFKIIARLIWARDLAIGLDPE
jgi:hypothetical protein